MPYLDDPHNLLDWQRSAIALRGVAAAALPQ